MEDVVESREWETFALCKQADPANFYPEPGETTKANVAKAICRQCPVRVRCLLVALMTNEDQGIRGGLGEDQRRRLRREWRKYESGELAGGWKRLERLITKTFWHLDHNETPVWIAERNTEGATHGRISTWNRGCRCDPCREAMSMSSHQRKQRESQELYA